MPYFTFKLSRDKATPSIPVQVYTHWSRIRHTRRITNQTKQMSMNANILSLTRDSLKQLASCVSGCCLGQEQTLMVTLNFLQLQQLPTRGPIQDAASMLPAIQGAILSNSEPPLALIHNIATIAYARGFVEDNVNESSVVSITNLVAYSDDVLNALSRDTVNTEWLNLAALTFCGILHASTLLTRDQVRAVEQKLQSLQNYMSSETAKDVLVLGSQWFMPAFDLLPSELHPSLVDLGIYLVHNGVHIQWLSTSEGDSEAMLHVIGELFQGLLKMAPAEKLKCMFERIDYELLAIEDLPEPPYWVYERVTILKRLMAKQHSHSPTGHFDLMTEVSPSLQSIPDNFWECLEMDSGDYHIS